jgi:cytochrome P450
VPLLPLTADADLADAVAVEEMTARPNEFIKPTWMYRVLSFFGQNVVITEGDVWRRHRRITAPAFSKVCGVRCSWSNARNGLP